jgi:hypothetical protein
VITYAAINLTNKKFQVGSTVDFSQRYKGHMTGDMNPEFSRSLQKHPENFYWIVSEDDGLETREEEQYYLDFYHGSVWCYNSNPNASEPPSQEGTCWWNDGVKQVKVFEFPGEGLVCMLPMKIGSLGEYRWKKQQNDKVRQELEMSGGITV